MDADVPAVVERWTPETEELVARTWLASVDPPDERLTWEAILPASREAYRKLARAALAALAEAGLLLPPGGVSREEWRVIYRDGRGQPVVWSEGQTAERSAVSLQRARAEGWPGAMSEVRRDLVWPDGTTLLGAWIEVPDVG